jgi:two-component system LytT family sensor kinase
MFWIAYIGIVTVLYGGVYRSGYIEMLKQTCKLVPFIMVSVYIILYILIPKFLFKEKPFLFIILFIFMTLFFISVYKYITLLNYNNSHPERTMPYFTFGYLFALYEAYIVISIASAIKIFKTWFKTHHKKTALEKQGLLNEIEILRYQINPHFLFNVLNNLYSLAIENNDETTANGISKLSGLMRYNIYTGKNEKVLLKQEVEYIQNYIKLQEIRFTGDYKLKVDFIIKGTIDSKLIVPFIFIMFVENAFKYGISLKNKSIIKIELEVFDKYIEFKVLNYKNKSANDIDSGIGLENAKKRLEHFYKTNYKLDITENDEYFNIFLRLNF